MEGGGKKVGVRGSERREVASGVSKEEMREGSKQKGN